jgi:hypothetical protein
MDIIYAAQSLGKIEGKGLGPFGEIARDATVGLTKITEVVSAVVGIMTVSAGIWFLFQLLIGGIGWISSGGDKHSLETARNRITHALVGIIIIFATWSILALVGKIFGFDILITNPADFVSKLKIN